MTKKCAPDFKLVAVQCPIVSLDARLWAVRCGFIPRGPRLSNERRCTPFETTPTARFCMALVLLRPADVLLLPAQTTTDTSASTSLPSVAPFLSRHTAVVALGRPNADGSGADANAAPASSASLASAWQRWGLCWSDAAALWRRQGDFEPNAVSQRRRCVRG